MSEPKTYQPGWGEHKENRHHHHTPRKRRLFGFVYRNDKQAYYGLMLVFSLVICAGIYFLSMLIINEFRQIPYDDPETEMSVDALRIHKVEEQKALQLADSISQAHNLDSIRHKVQIETRPVYRPPRKEEKWYITQREWKDIFSNIKRWKQSQKND